MSGVPATRRFLIGAAACGILCGALIGGFRSLPGEIDEWRRQREAALRPMAVGSPSRDCSGCTRASTALARVGERNRAARRPRVADGGSFELRPRQGRHAHGWPERASCGLTRRNPRTF